MLIKRALYDSLRYIVADGWSTLNTRNKYVDIQRNLMSMLVPLVKSGPVQAARADMHGVHGLGPSLYRYPG